MINPWDDISAPQSEVNVLRADASHPLDLFWAMDQYGNFLFFYEFQSNVYHNAKRLPVLKGIDVELRLAKNNSFSLLLSLKECSNWEIFAALCNDIIYSTRALDEKHEGFDAIINRLLKWHKLLSEKKPDIWSEEKIKGLIGELLFLKDTLLPKFGSSDAVKFWTGPEGFAQDFIINNTAVEIKTQMAGTASTIKISSEDQLCSEAEMLYLCVFTLGKADADTQNKINLPSLISAIRKILASESFSAITRFQNLLIDLKYVESELYYEFNYTQIGIQTFIVKEGFPRICANDLASGVGKVTYHIHLSECKKFEIRFSDWELIYDGQ